MKHKIIKYFKIKELIKNAVLNYRVVTVIGFVRLHTRIEEKFGKRASLFFFNSIKLVTKFTPLFIIKLFPKSITPIFGSCAQFLNFEFKIVSAWTQNAERSKYSGHRKAAFFIKANYMFENFDEIEFNKYIEKEIFGQKFSDELLNFYLTWSFHNNSQLGHSKLLERQMRKFEKFHSNHRGRNIRFLPEHTTNMGHLGYLFLYLNFYRQHDSDRNIAIWPEQSPNRYYLTQLIKLSPFKIIEIKGKPNLSSISPYQIDTLQYSRLSSGKWRLEASAAVPTKQSFPEFLVTEEFKLSVDSSLDNLAFSKLEQIGFNKNKWFVALHVKEDRFKNKSVTETRDSSIEAFILSCRLIYDLGGQVIRMGGSNFPKLRNDFPAIDYAHSNVKCEELDYWLWGNCKFWLGNSNGASVAVIPFGKPRLLVDLWPVHPFGPSTDFYLPKMLYSINKNRLLSANEIVSNKFSRTMKREYISKAGLKLIDSSPSLIWESTVEFFNKINSKLDVKSTSNSEFSNELSRSLQVNTLTDNMKIPNAFNNYLSNFNLD
jgi:putative glycosyltransferase (TIGR04372 family)